MAKRIDGRKLSRKHGPRLALYKNLTVSVLRYEKVKTTEAKAKEIQGRVERTITLAKRGDLAARRAVVAQFPNEPLVIDKLFDTIAPAVRRPDLRLHPDRPARPTTRRRGGDRTDRAGLRRADPEGALGALPRTGGIRRNGLRRLPGPTLAGGRSRENSKRRWPGSTPRGR